jgi:hypothetical protein
MSFTPSGCRPVRLTDRDGGLGPSGGLVSAVHSLPLEDDSVKLVTGRGGSSTIPSKYYPSSPVW